MKRLALLGAAGLIGLLPNLASAHSRFFVGVGVPFVALGSGYCYAPACYGVSYYAAAPAVVYSAPVICAPPAVVYSPPVVYAPSVYVYPRHYYYAAAHYVPRSWGYYGYWGR